MVKRTTEFAIKEQKRIKDEKVLQRQELIKDIQNSTKESLMMSIQKKANDVSQELENVLKNSSGLTSTQIFNLITNRSTASIDVISKKSYTPEELVIAFQIYKNMIAKINEKVSFPPNKTTFCQLLGISTTTYSNYRQNPDKMEIMQIIDDYIVGNILTSAQVGQLEKISSIFATKSQHGLVEASTPIVIEHKKPQDIDEIKRKMAEIKENAIEAQYEEKN